MTPIADRTLASSALADLGAWQAEVDATRSYGARIRAADEAFARRRSQVSFRPVAELLREMCSGVTRCMYCEDSGGVDVEHYRPKAWYPELVFAWANFLLVCARCNRRKSSRFPLFHPTAQHVHTPTRRADAPLRRPPSAAPVLLNPRVDDPSNYLALDLQDTFHFVETALPASASWLRARYTVDILDLNDADLPRSRRTAYQNYLTSLRCAGSAAQRNDLAELERVRIAIASSPCSVVWQEMRRQRGSIAALREAFDAVPAALGWS